MFTMRRLFACVRFATPLACATVAVACGAPDTGASSAPAAVSPATELPAFDEDPCAHLRGGDPGLHPAASDLSRAHALVRYFGTDPDGTVADGHLATALDAHAPASREAALAYASAVTGACAAPAGGGTMSPASLTMHDGVAVVVPGASDLPAIPEGATAVALDLRALSEGDEARAALDRALAAILHGTVALLDFEERTCNGQPDEIHPLLGTENDQYACTAATTKGRQVKGAAPRLPLAVLTAPALTPLAAQAAINLRVQAGAFVVGEAVPAQIAESTWVGIGDHGIAVHTRRLFANAKDLVPDVIPADVRAADPLAALAHVTWSAERSAPSGALTRTRLADLARATAWPARSVRAGDGRAALLTAHAATRTFFPYFDVVGDVIDARLDECLGMIEGDAAKDRSAVSLALQRFSEAIHDGHSSVIDRYRTRSNAFSPVVLSSLGDDFVIARSTTPDARPGEIVVAIDGKPVKDEHERLRRFISGSPQLTRDLAAEDLLGGKPTALTIQSGASQRTVTIQPGATSLSTFGMFDRAPGTLDDLGAPDVYYVSLDSIGAFASKPADLPAIEAAMTGKRGVVLDMRGYPGAVEWELLGYVASAESFGPKMFDFIVGPTSQRRELEPTQMLGDFGGPQGYAGPIVLLTGAYTQSSAEHWTSFFRSKKRGTIVGGKTSGANGTATGLVLPGGFGFSFTGMVVQHTDGSAFHAHGHTPDIEIAPTAADLRDGKDTVLLRALAELR